MPQCPWESANLLRSGVLDSEPQKLRSGFKENKPPQPLDGWSPESPDGIFGFPATNVPVPGRTHEASRPGASVIVCCLHEINRVKSKAKVNASPSQTVSYSMFYETREPPLDGFGAQTAPIYSKGRRTTTQILDRPASIIWSRVCYYMLQCSPETYEQCVS